MDNKPENFPYLKPGEVSLGLVPGKPGTGMSYALSDILLNYCSANPDPIKGEVMDKGESFGPFISEIPQQ